MLTVVAIRMSCMHGNSHRNEIVCLQAGRWDWHCQFGQSQNLQTSPTLDTAAGAGDLHLHDLLGFRQ